MIADMLHTLLLLYRHGMGLTKPICLRSVGFLTCHQLLNVAFIFDSCRRRSAAVIRVKYEGDSKNLTGIYAKSNISITNKPANGALITCTPVYKPYKDLTAIAPIYHKSH